MDGFIFQPLKHIELGILTSTVLKGWSIHAYYKANEHLKDLIYINKYMTSI